MSLLQRLQTFRKSKRAKLRAVPSAFCDRPSGTQTTLEASTEPLQEQKQPTSSNPAISSAAEPLKRPLAACQAQPAAPIDSTDATDAPGPQGDQRVDLQAQMLRQESGRHASVCGSMRLAASSFYGKAREMHVERCVLRIMAAARRKVQGEVADPFQIFPLQEPAFKWADAHSTAGNLRIFSVERGADGKRSFLVTTYAAFWARYQGMLPQHRHYYEIIRQNWPCHLYFDLEYPTEFNNDIDGNRLVDTLLDLCTASLKERFDIEFKEDCIVELDSSTPAKFSRHVIVRIPGAAFQSNFHVGAFVKDLCEPPGSAESPDSPERAPRQEFLIHKDAEGGQALFIDGGVYTRNRAFRLFLSSKAGKDAVLQPTERFRGAKLSHKDTFYSSLICNVEPGCRLLRCFEDAEGAAFSWAGSRGGSRADMAASIERCPHPQMGRSRHPDIEAFITSMCTQGGVQGQVRSWVDWPEAGLLLLNMRGNRWCGNVGRAHKSNGIFYVVDLQGWVWYQKCYDPECRQYRSQIMPLPPAIMQRLQAEAAAAAPAAQNTSAAELQQQAAASSDLEAASATAQDGAIAQQANLPAAAGDGNFPHHGQAYQHPQSDESSCRGHPQEESGRRTGIVLVDDMIYASGTGVFDEASADESFNNELLQLLVRCEKDGYSM